MIVRRIYPRLNEIKVKLTSKTNQRKTKFIDRHILWPMHAVIYISRCSPLLPQVPGENAIGGFNQRQGEALPPQIFLSLKFVVCIAFKIIEIVAT